jgi:hypothetical protein
MVGQSIHFTNASTQTHTVTHSASPTLFDSGDLPPGAAFSLTLGTVGDYPFTSRTAALAGTLHVTAVGTLLPGPPGDPARNHIPDRVWPRSNESDIGVHPFFELRASRTRLLVGFAEGATVAQANAALTAAGVTVGGGLPSVGVLMVTAPDTPDFSALDAALRSLRSDPGVAFASLSREIVPHSLPRPADPAFGRDPSSTPPHDNEWAWNLAVTTSGAPLASDTTGASKPAGSLRRGAFSRP